MAVRRIVQKQKQPPKAKRSRAKAATVGSGDELELSPAQMRELERRIEDLNCRTRYLIAGILDQDFVLYYNISEDTYGWNDPLHATLFKRRKAAQAIVQLIGDKDTIVECLVNKRGQLVKKSFLLPVGATRTKGSVRRRASASRAKSKTRTARAAGGSSRLATKQKRTTKA